MSDLPPDLEALYRERRLPMARWNVPKRCKPAPMPTDSEIEIAARRRIAERDYRSDEPSRGVA